MVTFIAAFSVWTSLVCSAPKMILLPGAAPWDANDEKVLNSAYEGCSRHFSTSPCVSRFYKTKTGHHHVVCGQEKK